jgi:5-methylcytosine-specific restriction endonuclease McrA
VDKHHIEETKLITRRSAREGIHKAWDHRCAYCGEPLGRSPTLDHVVPKVHGGLTVRQNLISCCLKCNRCKGHRPWQQWLREQAFYSVEREAAIQQWLNA